MLRALVTRHASAGVMTQTRDIRRHSRRGAANPAETTTPRCVPVEVTLDPIDRPPTETTEAPGATLTLADLPAPDTQRWVSRRKALVVRAVHDGLLTLEAACARYALSEEEFRSWERMIDTFGIQGLRTTRLQDYRKAIDDAQDPAPVAAESQGPTARGATPRRTTAPAPPRGPGPRRRKYP